MNYRQTLSDLYLKNTGEPLVIYKGVETDFLSNLYDMQAEGITPEQAFDIFFDKNAYRAIDEFAWIGHEFNGTPSYGIVIDADGTIYHLKHRYCHGLVIAMLYPDIAKKNGFFPPLKQMKHSFINAMRYEEFSLAHKSELPVIRAGINSTKYMSYTSKLLTHAQVASTKQWLVDNDLYDRKFLNRSGQQLIQSMQQALAHGHPSTV